MNLFRNLWAGIVIFHSNFTARYGALFNLAILLLLLAVFVLALLRAILAGRKGKKGKSPLAMRVPDAKRTNTVAETLALAIRCASVTGDEAGMQDMVRLLRRRFPLAFKTMHVASIKNGGILMRWNGEEQSALLPILFCGHLDVAPGGDGWTTCSPFDGLQRNGNVYGRGAMDGKGVVVALLEAVEDLLSAQYTPRRDLYFAFGFDEETGGKQGAQVIAQRMKDQNIRFEMILDEGGAFLDRKIGRHRSYSAAYIGVAEKLRCEYRVSATCPGGSTAFPEKDTAIGTLSEAICRIESAQPHHHLLPLVRNQLDQTMGTLSFGKRFIIANPLLMRLFAGKVFRDDPQLAALVRSTVIPSMLDGSFHAANMLPTTASATLDARLLPHDSPEKILRHLQNLVADLPVEVELTQPGEASRMTSTKQPMYRLLKSTIDELYPRLPCIPTLMTTFCDARHYSDLSDCVLRFSPLTLGEAGGGGTHAGDEFLSERSLGLAVEFYIDLLKKL